MKKVLVWLSGWVDSAVSAYLLKKQGYEVTAGFMINYREPENPNCPTRIDKAEAKKVAKFLDIPFLELDFVDDYTQKVLNYMYEWYKKWITPNPDIMCNKEVKFKVFLEEAEKRGFDYIAMGHYVRVVSSKWKVESKDDFNFWFSDWKLSESQSLIGWVFEGTKSNELKLSKNDNKTYHLLKWVDENKDQSYFLAGLSQEQISKALFPIGHLQKSEVRKIATKIWLPNAKRKDSQGICFVWKVKMADFLEKKIKPKPWIVRNTAWNILGEHKWVYYYTIGQRKGLDIWGQAEPIFVVRKDIEKNEIIVGTKNDLELYDDKLKMNNINFINPEYETYFTPYPSLSLQGRKEQKVLKAKCKIRYRQTDQDCEVIKLEKDLYEVKFKEAQRAIARWQICAVYLWDELVMSGVIV